MITSREMHIKVRFSAFFMCEKNRKGGGDVNIMYKVHNKYNGSSFRT